MVVLYQLHNKESRICHVCSDKEVIRGGVGSDAGIFRLFESVNSNRNGFHYLIRLVLFVKSIVAYLVGDC